MISPQVARWNVSNCPLPVPRTSSKTFLFERSWPDSKILSGYPFASKKIMDHKYVRILFVFVVHTRRTFRQAVLRSTGQYRRLFGVDPLIVPKNDLWPVQGRKHSWRFANGTPNPTTYSERYGHLRSR